jgi:hypothetical protein
MAPLSDRAETAQLVEKGAFMRMARELAIQGAENIGPVMTVAILEFAAKELEDRARDDGAWDEARAASYRRSNEEALDRLVAARRRPS